jgi:ribonucleoside-diphosphate reductase alpha subunit
MDISSVSQSNMSKEDNKKLIEKLSQIEPKINVDAIKLVFESINNFDDLNILSENVVFLSSIEPDCALLAGRLQVYKIHQQTCNKFSEALLECSEILEEHFVSKIRENAEILDSNIVHERDFTFDYFSIKTLHSSYLIRYKGKLIERPQYMFMRVALFIGETIEEALEIYRYISEKYFIFATPTLFNSGMKYHQLCSCFLLDIQEDSIAGIYQTLSDCAIISKNSGGIGLSIHKIRAKGSEIKGTGGFSNGIVPMLRVFNETARYVDQCFEENTLVYSKTGWKKIKDLKVGEQVLTRRLTWDRISKKKVFDYSGPVYRVVSELGEAIVTPSHPILIEDIDGFSRFVEVSKLGTRTKVITGVTEPLKITKIEKLENFKSQMYDLEIENVHSYLTVIGIAHNGGGKRKGAFAIYLEPWHLDIFDFLQLRKNTGKEEFRARDLFQGLWIPDLFMKRVLRNEHWTLFSPDKVPGLYEKYGSEFEELYEKYEAEIKDKKVIQAKSLWEEIIKTQIETGGPYVLFKDTCNRCSNQKNLGTIKSSNLCTEIIEYTDKDNIAVCNLVSISLPKFVKETGFDFEKLKEITGKLVKYLNRVIDINMYPNEKARNSNLKNRPIGIGVQGLADVFMMLRLPFTSEEARKLNKQIFRTIYFSAIKESCILAKKHGPYSNYITSPASQGVLHPEMFKNNRNSLKVFDKIHGYDSSFEYTPEEQKIKRKIKKYGLRNSLLIALMPTASTSQILGNIESFEPLYSNIFVRRTLSGDFVLVNKYLINDLKALGIWSKELKDQIILNDGSVQNIEKIPERIKEVYKTVWEIKQKDLIEMAIDRGFFIDQSQSMSYYISDPNIVLISSLHFYGWKNGLKTGMYYLRTKSAAKTIRFTIETGSLANVTKQCNGDICKACQ